VERPRRGSGRNVGEVCNLAQAAWQAEEMFSFSVDVRLQSEIANLAYVAAALCHASRRTSPRETLNKAKSPVK
jgi:hypothetical protein